MQIEAEKKDIESQPTQDRMKNISLFALYSLNIYKSRSILIIIMCKKLINILITRLVVN